MCCVVSVIEARDRCVSLVPYDLQDGFGGGTVIAIESHCTQRSPQAPLTGFFALRVCSKAAVNRICVGAFGPPLWVREQVSGSPDGSLSQHSGCFVHLFLSWLG